MIIHKNPHLICEPIDAEYYVCINPLITSWLKIITKVQKDILDLFENSIDLSELATLSWYETEDIKKYVNILSANDIVNFSWNFEHSQWNNTPNTLNLRVHTTDKCNLRCSYCYIHTKETFGDMDENTIDRLFTNIIETTKIHELDTVTLRLSWWEPTIVFKKRMDKLISLKNELETHGCILKIAFLTNWTIINEQQMDYIKDNKFWIAVSLDWIWEYHDQTRCYVGWKWSFQQVEKNIDELVKKWLKPNIMTVISNNNLDWLVDLTKFLIWKNLPFRYSFVQWEDMDQTKLLEVMNQCYDVLEKAIDVGYKFSALHKLCDLKFLNPYFQTCMCWFSWWAVYLDGGMYFCHVNFWEEQNNWNIHTTTDLLDLISKWTDKLSELSEDCKTCNYQYICTGGCPVERRDWKDPHCNAYKVLIPRVYQLLWKEKLLKILSLK